MKIGLLAMSGIRVRDQALLDLGLTLPGFVDRSKVVASLPSLGLLYLAAVTPRDHSVHYFESERDGIELPALFDCDLVAISSFSAQIFEAYAVADQLRSKGITVALGGLHVTALPEEALKHADHVIVGEGELVWPLVVAAVERKEAGRIWNARSLGPVKVQELPLPRYELLGSRSYNRFTVQTSRGCPWRCEFCASTVMLGAPYRKRPVESVIRDIEHVLAHRKHPFIEFADDNTFVDKRWGKQLCRAISPFGLKWFTETDVSVADDSALLEAMAEAGCRQVLIGLESPTAPALQGLERRADFKAKRFDDYGAAIQRIQSHGITVNGCFILGLDNHDTGIFDRVYDFARDVGLFEVQVTILTPFPGTPLYASLLRQNRLLRPHDWSLCTLFDVNFLPARMSVDELRSGFRSLVGKLYTSEALAERRAPFFRHLRNRPLDPGFLPLEV